VLIDMNSGDIERFTTEMYELRRRLAKLIVVNGRKNNSTNEVNGSSNEIGLNTLR